jgi:eukaryotic-like serine/threonine-protein kinase
VEQLPEFDYLRKLGGGQFGEVFLCRSLLNDELRAVKHIALKGSGNIAAWRAEAEALAACRNDHVVRIYHAAATGEGPVLVMEYLPGGDAEERWLPAGGPVGEVVDCLLDATWGLHHLHAAGLVHRDLKPANLLFDAKGRAVIGDFGLAGRKASRPGVIYAPHQPPEVVVGGDWTTAADIYALGVTGWRLLGAPPMPDLADLDEAIRRGSWPNRDAWPVHVHAGLRRALCASMHADPARRPASASDLREALVTARPVVDLAQIGPGSWHGNGDGIAFAITCLRKDGGWVVKATRDKGSGARRLAPDTVHTKRAGAVRCVQAVLEAVATRGRIDNG